MCTGFYVEFPLFSSDFNRTINSLTNFRKILKYKFHEYRSGGNRVVPCEEREREKERETHEPTDGRKKTIKVGNRKFAKEPKNLI